MTDLEMVRGLSLEFPIIPEGIIRVAYFNLFTAIKTKSGNRDKLEISKINARHFWK